MISSVHKAPYNSHDPYIVTNHRMKQIGKLTLIIHVILYTLYSICSINITTLCKLLKVWIIPKHFLKAHTVDVLFQM